MAHIRTYTTTATPAFLASAEGLVRQTVQVSQTGVEADEYGYKIVKAGTIYPTNDVSAKGILFEDVDVTDGDHEGSLVVAGWIYSDRLPAASEEAVFLPGITFETSPTTTR